MLAGTGSLNGIDPLLTAPGDCSGSTQMRMLKPGSPATDVALGSEAPFTDQRGVSRPLGNGYEIGAVEVTESDNVYKVYIPVTIK